MRGGMVAWWHGGMVAWWHGGMVAWWHGGMMIILILTADNDGVDVCSAINPGNAGEKAFLIHGLADEIRSKSM